MPRGVRPVVAVALVASVPFAYSVSAQQSHTQSLAFSLLEQYLEPLRQQAGIPGLSAAIIQDGETVWDRAFGFRDVEASLPARYDTPYAVADLTQTFTAVMIQMCVESGLLDLDQPISTWSPLGPNGTVTLRQVLAHALSNGPTPYKYDPSRFASLTAPLEECGKAPYRKLLAQRVLDRLAMVDAVPGRDFETMTPDLRELFGETLLEQYRATLARVAVPYKVDRRGRATRNDTLLPAQLDPSRGLIASVADLAKYDDGLEKVLLRLPESREALWTNSVLDNVALPTGLGWFVQMYEGERLIWHFGLTTDAYSSLYLKVPSRRLTLILLANSDGLSGPFSLEKGDVTSSVFAKTFLRLFL